VAARSRNGTASGSDRVGTGGWPAPCGSRGESGQGVRYLSSDVGRWSDMRIPMRARPR
jgi:hypothetical protein